MVTTAVTLPVLGFSIAISLAPIVSSASLVVLKALLDHRITEQFIPVLYGSGRAIAYYKKQNKS